MLDYQGLLLFDYPGIFHLGYLDFMLDYFKDLLDYFELL